LKPFKLLEPQSLEDALELLATNDPMVRPFAGGTALMLMMKSKLFQPSTLISMNNLKKKMNLIYLSDEGDLHIGAMASLRELEVSPDIQRFSPVITKALHTLSNVRVRNVATIGGHLAHADPHMDLPPILMALNARIKVTDRSGSRWVNLEDFVTGYYSTILQPGDLITEVVIPVMPDGMQGAYLKYTSISADDWPTVGSSAFVRLNGGQVQDVRVSVSAATEKAVRLSGAEALLLGKSPTDALIAEAADLVAAEIQPLADIRGSAGYKREIVRVCVQRTIASAVASAQRMGEGLSNE